MKFNVLIILLFFNNFVFSQIITTINDTAAVMVKKGETLTLSPKNQTFWVMSTSQVKKLTIGYKQNKFCQEEKSLLKQQTDSLRTIVSEQEILIDTLKGDRNFYKKQWLESEDDLKALAELNDSYSKKFRISVIVGSAATFTAFVVGFILGIK